MCLWVRLYLSHDSDGGLSFRLRHSVLYQVVHVLVVQQANEVKGTKTGCAPQGQVSDHHGTAKYRKQSPPQQTFWIWTLKSKEIELKLGKENAFDLCTYWLCSSPYSHCLCYSFVSATIKYYYNVFTFSVIEVNIPPVKGPLEQEKLSGFWEGRAVLIGL